MQQLPSSQPPVSATVDDPLDPDPAIARRLGKHVTGVEALYVVESAVSFRAAWDLAEQIGRERNGLNAHPPFAGSPPGINRRPPRRGGAAADPGLDDSPPPLDDEAKRELVGRLADKYLAKLEAERAARLAGQIVAADFYLRQVTLLEIAFDLMSEGAGLEPWAALRDLRRGGHGLIDIVATPFSQALDDCRQAFWTEQGDPPRPDPVSPRHAGPLCRDAESGRGYRLALPAPACGPASHPAAGVAAEDWAVMPYADQQAAHAAEAAREAALQIRWERRARRAARSTTITGKTEGQGED